MARQTHLSIAYSSIRSELFLTLVAACIGWLQPAQTSARNTRGPAQQGSLGSTVTKTVSHTSANVDDTLTYTITVANPTPTTLGYWGPIDTLSPTLSVLSGTPGYSTTSSAIGWNPQNGPMAFVAPSSSAVYTFTAQVTGCGDGVNVARIIWRPLGAQEFFTEFSQPVTTTVNCLPRLI